MSIKIYDGMISTATDPFDAAKLIREALEPLFFAKFVSLLPDTSMRSIDDLYQEVEKLHASPTYTFDDRSIFYDVTLLPNAKGGNPLVLLFSENKNEYNEALLAAGAVREFGYWDNSDPDDDVSAEEWEYRKLAWSNLLDPAATPARIGLELSAPDKITTSIEVRKLIR